MRILAINSGSSSIKCALIESDASVRGAEFRIEDIGGADTRLVCADTIQSLGSLRFDAALEKLFAEIERRIDGRPDAVVHRIVHGGERFLSATRIDDAVLRTIAEMSSLAPLHNPPALRTLRAARTVFADAPHVAVFDTAFHATLPRRAREYALPNELTNRFGIRRFGFHGINHAHVAMSVADYLRTIPQNLRIVSCHLGNGASVAAIEYGRSVETSMGMTPLEGLVMGTRSGDVDPGVLLRLLDAKAFDARGLDVLLNKESGLLGLTGTFDFAQIERRAADGDEACRAAITLYAHRVRKYVGAYAAVMGGVDAIAFTAGIGEHSPLLRHRVCQRLDFLGAVLDEDGNRDARVNRAHPIAAFSAAESRVKLLVVAADEEMQMAREAAQLLSAEKRERTLPRIPIAISARHAHLSAATLRQLFGPNFSLHKRRDLIQEGQFAAEETVALIGPRGRIDGVRLMGPPRREDQIEISRSDEFALGVDAPVRLSGDLANSPGITLEGPHGRASIPHGVICARRHIHMNPEDAKRFNVRDHDSVAVRIDSNGRDLVFADVIVRVDPSFRLELHLDTDEANAAGVEPHQQAELLSSAAALASRT